VNLAVNQSVRTAIRLTCMDSRSALDSRELPPTLTVEQAAAILGCGRTLAYELIRRGEFPSRVIKLGNRRYVIPTADLLRVIGVDAG
jgi:excisionase family DNA binding protein